MELLNKKLNSNARLISYYYCVAFALPVFEKENPNDNRLRIGLEKLKLYALKKIAYDDFLPHAQEATSIRCVIEATTESDWTKTTSKLRVVTRMIESAMWGSLNSVILWAKYVQK